ncbi:MAG: tRNA lysidine(34) synthetase TilS [Candidatus Sericytochromatia bacterium]|nr:tRNA lysidine(34) synthetase TilS [Candidatus Sericytochromatia bacterium]
MQRSGDDEGGLAEALRNLLETIGVRPSGGPILVGLSGGSDSMALTLALREAGYSLQAAHLDHGCAPSSARDADWVEDWCQQQNIRLFRARMAFDPGVGFETRAREARLAWLANCARMHGCPWVALGHQREDQAETLIFRLARGTGPEGLRGILPVRPLAEGVQLLHPLLGFSRDRLQHYLSAAGHTWLSDPSNDWRERSRNRIRHEVLPALRQIHPEAVAKVAELAALVREEEAEAAGRTARWLSYCVEPLDSETFLLDRLAWLRLSPLERARALRFLSARAAGRVLGREALRRAEWAFQQGLRADLGGGWSLSACREGLLLARQSGDSLSIPFSPEVEWQPTERWGWRVRRILEPSAASTGLGLRLAATTASGAELAWRSARPDEDQFCPGQGRRLRRLKHWLTRRGIPRYRQAHLLVLAEGSRVLWVVGYAVAWSEGSPAAAADCFEMQATPCFQV